MTLSAVFPLFGHALLLAVLFTLAAARLTEAPRGRQIAALAGFAIGFVPLGGLALLGYLRAVLGDLSITTVVLLVLALVSSLGGPLTVSARERLATQLALVATAVVLYPLALGVGGFDPYALGYASTGMVVGMFLVALGAWFARLHLLAICITAAGAAFLAGALESSNLWDYLIDPLAAVYALAGAAAFFSGKLRQQD